MSGANSTPLGRMNPAIGAGKKQGGCSMLNPSYMGNMPPPPSGNSHSHSNSSSQKRDYEAERKHEGLYHLSVIF